MEPRSEKTSMTLSRWLARNVKPFVLGWSPRRLTASSIRLQVS